MLVIILHQIDNSFLSITKIIGFVSIFSGSFSRGWEGQEHNRSVVEGKGDIGSESKVFINNSTHSLF